MSNQSPIPSLTQQQYGMHQQVQQMVRENNFGWTRDLCKATEFPDIRTLDYPVTLGSYTYTAKTKHHKWLHASHARNYGGGYCTPGDMARDYLAIKYDGRRIRCTGEQARAAVDNRKSAPLYCQPQVLESAVYLDITSAYWQIVRAVGWNVDYNPGKFLNSKSRMDDFPYPNHKGARNCLVTVGLPSTITLWTGSELRHVKSGSKFTNFILYRLVMDVLNGIAREMVNHAGAAYVYTDGYIIASNRIAAADRIFAEWGLSYSIKHEGRATIIGSAVYAFTDNRSGSYATEGYKQAIAVGRNLKPRAIDKIDDRDCRWLKERFADFGRKGQAEFTAQEQEAKVAKLAYSVRSYDAELEKIS